MTRDEALQAIEEIRSMSGDPEAAHAREDDLYERFISAVANSRYSSIREARNVAEVIVDTKQFDFPRWCA